MVVLLLIFLCIAVQLYQQGQKVVPAGCEDEDSDDASSDEEGENSSCYDDVGDGSSQAYRQGLLGMMVVTHYFSELSNILSVVSPS